MSTFNNFNHRWAYIGSRFTKIRLYARLITLLVGMRILGGTINANAQRIQYEIPNGEFKRSTTLPDVLVARAPVCYTGTSQYVGYVPHLYRKDINGGWQLLQSGQIQFGQTENLLGVWVWGKHNLLLSISKVSEQVFTDFLLKY
jgi:hypothetical protein